jgi:threonine synthase
MSIWRWAHRFCEGDPLASEYRISLGEGETPLVRSRRLGPAIGAPNLYFKLETSNPTGSYKDRFAAAAVGDMLANKRVRCLGTSSGNTGSALAAYCAAAGIPCELAIVETAPAEKLRQMLAYGASLYRVRDFGRSPDVTARVFEFLAAQGSDPGADAALQISAYRYSPAGMRGVQTISYELAEQCDGALAHVFVPAGGGGLTLAVARGFEHPDPRCGPAVHCVQPEGNDTIATPLRRGDTRARAVDGKTRISGLQVPNVMDGDDVIAACRRSGGNGFLVADEDVWRTQAALAREEGIFSEPAGAVSVAAALAAIAAGEVPSDQSIACVVTGSGFKDSSSVDRMIAARDVPTIELQELLQSEGQSIGSNGNSGRRR